MRRMSLPRLWKNVIARPNPYFALIEWVVSINRGVFPNRVIIFMLIIFALATPAQAALSLEVEIANHSTVSGDCSFQVVIQPLPQEVREKVSRDLRLELPGFQGVRVSEPDSKGKITVTARITRSGFFPFQVSLRWDGREYSARDYFVAELPATGLSAFDHLGYYVFLGRGDFWDETHQLALWSLQDWKGFVDWMSTRHADTLYVLLNGYTLAYPSGKYPALRDKFSYNARYGFLREFIDYAHDRGIRVYLTLTTDDHAEGFGNSNPETVRLNRFGYASSRRALDLENPKVRKYILDMLEETIQLYGNADGFVFHPSEEDPDHFNEDTRASYHHDTGKELVKSDKSERYRWYNEKFAELLRAMFDVASARNSKFEFIMFNTWWQDDYVSVYRRILPSQFNVCVWYYDEQEEKTFRKWPIWPWVEGFGAERITYMPTGEAFLYPQEHSEQVERHLRTDRLISAAESLGVKSCIFFAGWDLGSDEDRRRDLAIAQFPILSFVSDPHKKQEFLPELYTKYFAVRQTILK